MTLKYESELIKDIVDTRGHEKSSLHYESECIETWIEETKGAYPKLCDYESEWLNYMCGNEIGEFPYETVTANPTATINNVVPYSYKSAILKGQTLVNVHPTNYKVVGGSTTFFLSQSITKTMIKPNTRYFLRLYNTHQSIVRVYFKPCVNNSVNLISSDNKCAIFTTKSAFTEYDFTNNKIHFYSSSELALEDVKDTKVILCEYVDGMENWDIPYFEGMQSIKMPVLTATGKNFFDTKSFFNDWKGKQPNCIFSEIVNGEEVLKIHNLDGHWSENMGFKIFVEKDVPLTLTIKCKKVGTSGTNAVLAIRHSDSSFVTIGDCFSDDWVERTLTFTPMRDYIVICSAYNVNDFFYVKDIQLEVGSTATSYEPFKANILTVNEDVELRGIGDVQDTLDCLTGEVTERIGEIALDGSEDWVLQTNQTDDRNAIYRLSIADIDTTKNNNIIKCICDKAMVGSWNDIYSTLMDKTFAILNNQQLRVQFNGSVEELKSWLSDVKPTVQYLKTESIKTVELTVVNQNNETLNEIKPLEGTMHIKVAGNPINPTGVFEIPVEAITQNLGSFIEGEK